LARVHSLATRAWIVLATGAGLGFVARDLLGLRQPLVALAWLAGAYVALAPPARRGRAELADSPPPTGRRTSRERGLTTGPAPRGSGGGVGQAAPPGFRGSGEGGQAAAPSRRQSGDRERGQATIEWLGLVLLVALALAALSAVAPRVDGWSFGGFLTARLVCAVSGRCLHEDDALALAYGSHGAALVRSNAPNLVYEPGERELPVDWRRCRRRRCAEAPDERGLDVRRSDSGERATVFTHLLRSGGRTYIEYWFYYPDSNTTWAGSDRAWALAWLVPRLANIVPRRPSYPGFHRDDWEGFVTRLDPDGSAWVRASSHGHWQSCKEKDCVGDWIPSTGWTRVSRGSHAGHIPLRTEFRRGGQPVTPREAEVPRLGPSGRRGPGVRRIQIPLVPGRDLDERTTTSDGLRLIPLESRDPRGYHPHADAVEPPWEKDVYTDPESDKS